MRRVIRGLEKIQKRLKEAQPRKLADIIPFEEMRRLPPIGVQEVQIELEKGREPTLMPFKKYRQIFRQREETLPLEFKTPTEAIRNSYEMYKKWFKTKGRPERYRPYRGEMV